MVSVFYGPYPGGGGGGEHDQEKLRILIIHRFMTSHPVAKMLLCFGAKHKEGRPMLFGFLVIFSPTGKGNYVS